MEPAINESSGPDIFYFDSPLGLLKIITRDDHLITLSFTDDVHLKPTDNNKLTRFNTDINHQLIEYFQGTRSIFDIPIKFEGTQFEKDVWQHLLNIPYGQTITYGSIANHLGDMKKVRAVGRTVGKNPVGIIVPCHRVIGSNGHMTGYAGGLWRKEWLLRHEGVLLL
jgi:methylated-DNA-[protein]-cysteine S-methyltransferase